MLSFRSIALTQHTLQGKQYEKLSLTQYTQRTLIKVKDTFTRPFKAKKHAWESEYVLFEILDQRP